jgi:Nucleotidyltransferase
MLLELSADQARQYIDATAVFTALEQASAKARHYAGAMFWREIKGRHYLIRTTPGGAQTSLGVQTDCNRHLPERFNDEKAAAEQRLRHLKVELVKLQRLNKALRVGRCPPIVIDTLAEIANAGLAEHFLVVGTHAIYAYETAANVLCPSEAMATRDVDLLLDTRKQMKFVTQMKRLDSSFLNVLRRADKSFELRHDQLYTAVNSKGFEIDVIRRKAIADDPHPLRLSDDEDDFWAVQTDMGGRLLSARPFEQIVVSTTGTMARMKTVHPLDFVRIKRALAALPGRERQKFRKDALQAEMVLTLVNEYLPQLQAPQPRAD